MTLACLPDEGGICGKSYQRFEDLGGSKPPRSCCIELLQYKCATQGR